MLQLFKKKELQIFSPVDGNTIDLTLVPDNVFSSKMMGEGIAFELTGNRICAPCDGEITMIFPTLHAFGMKTSLGVELLIHIGLETVELEGKGFTKLVENNQKVIRGKPIIEVNLEFMKNNNVVLITPMIVTNSQDYVVTIEQYGKVKAGESLVMKCAKK